MLKNTTGVEKTHSHPEWMLRRDRQRGQVIVEYAILVVGVTLGIIGVTGYFLNAIGGFYLNLIKILTLPFP